MTVPTMLLKSRHNYHREGLQFSSFYTRIPLSSGDTCPSFAASYIVSESIMAGSMLDFEVLNASNVDCTDSLALTLDYVGDDNSKSNV